MGWNLRELITKHDIPGAQVAVLADGVVEDEAAGVLSRHTGAGVTPFSAFRIGSITKVWTATLVQQLVGEGLVDLDRPVRDQLPGFLLNDAHATASLTPRHLLAHTGGLDANHVTGAATTEEFVAALAGADHPFPPGAVFSYSNSGFVVLGRLVEVLRGKPFHDVLRERLATPLGLRTVATGGHEANPRHTAVGHDGGVPTTRLAGSQATAPSGAHLAMSARDLLEFVRPHLTDPALAALREPQPCSVPDFGGGISGWGLGWMRHPGGAVGHTGVSRGQKAFLRVLPSAGLAVVVLTNSTAAEALAHEIFTAAGLPAPPPAAPPAAPEPIEDGWCGTYRTTLHDITLGTEGGRAFLTYRPRNDLARSFSGKPENRVEVVRLGEDTIITATPRSGAHQVMSLVGPAARPGLLHNGSAAWRIA
ncbi:CubicO group peptidase, beta-lactamase class C family [Lentzea xinjiangensis]|uniref:CubicO group peptidase, beta-lactamase class C family n=1 Tax=Lentzea xinjiangensis TaxID=402600 RepID=A0A1H9M498_9PSEU|nr:serine hydrolase domain-containing protein [Lentzea xinjiangensis]SER18494.1 CubicO group peptidase, beta-lactamase class C family [Lentzea xinjiangensis]